MVAHHFSTFFHFFPVRTFVYRSGETLPAPSGESSEGKKKNVMPKNPDNSSKNPKSLDAQAQAREASKIKENQAELHDIAVKSNLIGDIQLLSNQTYSSNDLFQMKHKMMDVMETIRGCLTPQQIKYLCRFTIYLHPGNVFTVKDKSQITSKSWLTILDCFNKSSHEITVEILDRLELIPPDISAIPRNYELSEKQQFHNELSDVATAYGKYDIRLWNDEKYDAYDVRNNLNKIRNVFYKISILSPRNSNDPSAPFRALSLVPIYLNPGSIFSSIGIKEGYHPAYKAIAIDYTESEDDILDDIRRGLADFVKTLSPAELERRLAKKASDDNELMRPYQRRRLFELTQERARKFSDERKEREEKQEKKQIDVSLLEGRKLALKILSSKKLTLPMLRADMLAISNVFYFSSRDSWKPLSPPQPGIETAERNGVHFFRIRTKGGDRYMMRKDNSWVETIVSQRDLDKFRDTSERLTRMLASLILTSGRGLRASQFEYYPRYPGCLVAEVDPQHNSDDASRADSELRVKTKTHPNFFAIQSGVVGSLDTEIIKKLRPPGR